MAEPGLSQDAKLTPTQAGALLARVRSRVAEVILGKDAAIELALVAVLAGGHLLVEDVPGVGKTTLANTLAAALGGSFRRVQFTADLLPSDVLGATVLEPGGGLGFRAGPIFANVVLADEINRSPPKTQSCLLEAMGERRVSVDGVTHELPRPFLVLATQNPHEDGGTFPLPDSQLDRFLLRLSLGYPDREAERAVLRAGGLQRARGGAALEAAELHRLLGAVDAVQVHPEVEDYLLELVARTRADSRLLRGVSTRGAEALYRASRALALCRGRGFVTPDDVQELAVPVLAHRVVPRGEGVSAAERALRALLHDLPAPAL